MSEFAKTFLFDDGILDYGWEVFIFWFVGIVIDDAVSSSWKRFEIFVAALSSEIFDVIFGFRF